MTGLSDQPFEPLAALTPEVLRRAIAIYLEHAYPDGAIPAGVAERLAFRDDRPIRAILAAAPFERLRKAGDSPLASYAIRLGHAGYPHMKLEIAEYPCPAGYVLIVNTHDQMQLRPDWPGHDQFRALQQINLRCKQAIEAAWDAAGLPTFHRTLQGIIDQHKDQKNRPGRDL